MPLKSKTHYLVQTGGVAKYNLGINILVLAYSLLNSNEQSGILKSKYKLYNI